ncbi:MAG: hypothetical protein DRJ47_06500 [Thermoprotei archaeon]|nr:MAG: hypothetical protein DRJ47_06500 [Thermoprotei archaeon]
MADEYLVFDRDKKMLAVKKAATTGGTSAANRLVALSSDGKLHSSLFPESASQYTINLPAYEDLSPGDFVNIFDDSGTAKVRKADASTSKPAHGYVLSDATAGSNVTVYFDGHNTQLTNLTPGKYYFLSDTTPGGVTDAPPSAGISQKIGVAINSTTIDVEISAPIDLGSGGDGGSPAAGCYGVFGGGEGASVTNVIDYVVISNTGNASDFGDLVTGRKGLAATSNGTNDRGLFGGGNNESSLLNTIEYVTISSPGNAASFGYLGAEKEALAATSNGTNDRGIFGGGYDGSNRLRVTEYVTISSTPTVNATTFGNLTEARQTLAATSNGTNDRGIFGGGFNAADEITNTIDYVTISSPSNATNFGDLTVSRYWLAATSNGTDDRGIFGGGHNGNPDNTIDYVTISSPSNASDFGDLSAARYALAATSNGIDNRGVFGGGNTTEGIVGTIDYVTISSAPTVTASYFGDLTTARRNLAATSNA